MKEKYPEKQLIFILDNLGAHKSSLIWEICQNYPNCVKMLYTPAGSP